MLQLKDWIGRNSEGNQEDILPVKNSLKSLGYYKEPDYGMTEYPDDEMFDGIINFQKKYNLKTDGIMKPRGETEKKMNDILNSAYRMSATNTNNNPSQPADKDINKRVSSGAENSMEKMLGELSEKMKNTSRRNVLESPLSRVQKEQNPQIKSPDRDYKLGTLSSEFESLGNPSAIGFDKTGGHSYGKYQIETRKGTMKDYLSFMRNNSKYADYFTALDQAGGYDGALNKSNNFEQKWLELAKDDKFNQSQKDFIIEQKLKPLLNKTKTIKGLNLDVRHPAVKDVLYSIAVQHGENGGKNLLLSALGNDVEKISDEEFIKKLYDERSKVDKYFQKSSPELRKNIYNRFIKEREKALGYLK